MRLHKTILAALIILGTAANLHAEYIFLKDGSIIQGQILSENTSEITILKTDKKTVTVKRSDTMRVLYTEIYLGKIFIQLTNGKNIGCYMVDEDRETYTFRMELYSPEEFKYKREQVLFIARGNPTGLEGTADTTTADLKWFPPYQPAKNYRVYIKAQNEKEYRFADETSSKEIKLKGLSSNTKYTVRVTAVDSTGDESLPSNEFIFTTKNIPPPAPVISKIEKLASGDFKISWKEAADSDGKTTGYRIFKTIDGVDSLLTEVKKTEYVLKKNEQYDAIYVAAFDDLKTESEYTRVYFDFPPVTGIGICPVFLLPLGKLGDLADFGFGATVKYEMSNYFLRQLELGAETSFIYLPGKSGYLENESKSNGIMLIPVLFNAGYAFHPVKQLAVTPCASFGATCVFYDYNYYDIPSSSEKNVSDVEFDLSAGMGLNLRYEITESIYAAAAAGYRIFFEDSGSFSYCTISIGAGMRF